MTQTVVITGARAPLALHLARLFHASGRRVILADTLRWPLARATRCKRAYERLPPPAEGLDAYVRALAALMDRWSPDLVVPTCEEVFHLAAARDLAGLPLPLFAPSLDILAQAHDKNAFSTIARGFGADPPDTRLLKSAADAAALADGDIVLKPVWSRFGSRTLVRPSPSKRARVRPTARDPWVAQAYLSGEDICACAVATDGVVAACQAYRPLWRAGLGAGVAFAPLADPVIDRFVTGFCARWRWTGHVAFDFRRDAMGHLHAIECNPRPTSGVHFFGPDDGLSEAILHGNKAEASGTAAMTLPLALATYGFAQAARARRLRPWLRDLRTMRDIAAWPGEGRLLGAQLVALGEIAATAVRRRKGLRAAATDDIEWNGNGFRR